MTVAERDSRKDAPKEKTPFQRHYSAGLECLAAGDCEKASHKFLQAAVADPEKWCEAAIEIGRTGNPELALACLSGLLKIGSAERFCAPVWNAIGNIYSNAGNRDEAMECFKTSWDLNPHQGSASNRALVHLWNEEIDEAERWIKRALDMNPWTVEAQFVQAMISLVGRGDYRTGFRQYECRWRSRLSGLKKLPSDKPEWPGPSAHEGRLLVYGEQGMGDTILVLRYAKLIRQLGLKQIWVVQEPVKSLAESMGIIDEIRSPGEEFNEYDFHIPAISLIRCFGTSIEDIPPAPYLGAFWTSETFYQSNKTFRVGVCWQGSSVNRNNPIRSAPLSAWAPVFAVEGVEFHSFQVDNQFDAFGHPQIKITLFPKDWRETAQRVSQMDLVISVDTALVHLCGAMGVPCWVPLHCRPYFVYPIIRKDCPWYPSLRLFKQKREHQWGDVFNEIANELRKVI